MHKLRQQGRVIFALMIREMTTRFGGSSFGYLWALIEPVGFVALLVAVFSQIAHSPPVGKSFALFYATGYMAFFLWNDIAAVTGRSVHVNKTLLMYPAVTPLDAVLARFLLQVLTGSLISVILFGGILAIFDDPVAIDLGAVLAAIGLAALLGLGVGLANIVLFAASKNWEVVWGIVSRPLFLVSCVFFSFDAMPRYVQEVLWWNPLVHLVGLMRAGFYPAYDASYVSVLYVAYIGLALSCFGLLAMRAWPHRLVEA